LPSRRAGLRLRDIVENVDRVQRYIAGMTQAQFLNDIKTMDAVERGLSRISEAAIKLGTQAEELCPQVPWPDIRGIGNQLRHGYDAIVPARIWFTIENDLGPLRQACEPFASAVSSKRD